MTAEDTADGLVGAGHAELDQLALDVPVAPASVLAGQAQDEFSALGDQTGGTAPGAAGEQGPLRWTRSRCQRNRVSGLTRKQSQFGRGRRRLKTGEHEAISSPPVAPDHRVRRSIGACQRDNCREHIGGLCGQETSESGRALQVVAFAAAVMALCWGVGIGVKAFTTLSPAVDDPDGAGGTFDGRGCGGHRHGGICQPV